MKKNQWPKVVTRGNVSVRVYRVKHANTAGGHLFTVAWKSPGGRKTVQFADERKALDEAGLKAELLNAGRIEAADISREDRDLILAIRELCGNTPPLAALNEWAKIRDISGGNGIAAAKLWAKNHSGGRRGVTVASVMDDFIRAKSAAGVKMKASYDKIFPRVRERFGARVMAGVSTKELQDWFSEVYQDPCSRNTVRKRVVSLWRWASENNYIERGRKTEAEFTRAYEERGGEIGIIDTATARAILEFFRDGHGGEFLAAAAVAIFCGLRRSEIHGQKWEDVFLDRKFLKVTSAKPRTPQRRIVQLCDAAVAWLALVPEKWRRGNVCARSYGVDHLRRLAREAGFKLPENCFRHAFISHRVAKTGDVAGTSLEAGNTSDIVFRHYRELVTKQEGNEWFEIFPKS